MVDFSNGLSGFGLQGSAGSNALIALIALIALVATASADTPSAREVVQNTSDDLLALIEEAHDYAEEDPERFFVEVEALLRPVVDFSGFARNVMAVHYKKATEDQRVRFAETFKWGLVRSYALALTGFSEGEVVLVPADRPPRSPKRESVKMEIHTRTGEVYPLVYSMALGPDNVWRMRNIIINGVNIGLTYRSQFASAATDNKYGGDLNKVIDAWANVVQSNGEEDEESTDDGEGDTASVDEAES